MRHLHSDKVVTEAERTLEPVEQPGMVETERETIGLLKAFGYRNGAIALHYAQLALLLCLASFAGYFLADVEPRPNGGSWYGYLLGTIGFGLIFRGDLKRERFIVLEL